jgi:transcription antitermination factor NusG
MPILPAEPACYPAHLFSDEEGLEAPEGAWWVLHTKPRQEKALARQLVRLGVPFYLPQVVRRTRISGRMMRSHVPLFPGYVFMMANEDQRIAALATARVVRTLPVPAQDRLWRDLRQVFRLIATGAPITPEGRLEPSVTVEISSGPLAGLTGKIVRAASGRRFVVAVDFIQQGASVLLDDFMLTPIP